MDSLINAGRLLAHYPPPPARHDSAWLVQAGFRRDGDDWYCDGGCVSVLRPGEVVSRRSLCGEGGITFVE